MCCQTSARKSRSGHATREQSYSKRNETFQRCGKSSSNVLSRLTASCSHRIDTISVDCFIVSRIVCARQVIYRHSIVMFIVRLEVPIVVFYRRLRYYEKMIFYFVYRIIGNRSTAAVLNRRNNTDNVGRSIPNK